MNLDDLKDLELLNLIRDQNEEAQETLISRYKKMVRASSRVYFILGGDKDDIIQEGMIGLFKAVQEYDENRGVEFFYYAKTCIENQIINAIKKANRQKNSPLNNYLSFDKNLSESSENRLISQISSHIQNPEEIIINKENIKNTEETIKSSLSKFENDVLAYYLEGNSYIEIAAIVGKDEKSIDNALQRIRKKIAEIAGI